MSEWQHKNDPFYRGIPDQDDNEKKIQANNRIVPPNILAKTILYLFRVP